MSDANVIQPHFMNAASSPAVASLREDLDIYPGARTPEGAPTWVIHDPVRNRFFNIGWLEFEALKRWRGSAENVAARVVRETPLRTSKQHIEAMERFFTGNQLVRDDRPGMGRRFARQRASRSASRSKWLLHNYLFFRIPLFRPDHFLQRTLPSIRFVYSPAFRWLVMLVAAIGVSLVLRQWDAFLSTFPYLFSVEGMVLFGLAIMLTKVVHELGHAYTAKYYGLKVPTMGVAFLVMWPVMYTDTSEAWKLPSRRGRLAIGAAGMAAELALAAFATLLWSFLPDGPLRGAVFFVAGVSWVITLVINLNPFMRWDGYYLLADFLGVENLQTRAFSYARWWLRERLFGFGDPAPERFPREKRRIILLYAYATWLYRLVLFLGIALLIYNVVFKLAGIVLVTVEIGWFIARPIVSEINGWYKRRDVMRWNGNTTVSALALLALIGLLVVPWQSTIDVPALLRPQQHAQLYPPLPARIARVDAANGQRVGAGQVLFELEAPGIGFDLAQAATRITDLELALSRQSTQELGLDQRLLLENQLAAARAKHDGLAAQQQRLRVRAPFDGEIFNIPDGVKPGRWVRDDFALGLVVDRSRGVVEGYLTEQQVVRAKVGDSGVFYPESTEAPAFKVMVKEVDDANVTVLEEPYSASIYGGGVAVTPGRDGQLIAHNAVFRIRLLPLPDEDPSTQMQHMLRGSVVLEAESKSFLARAWQFASAVVIRESGF